jgi:hypothetical protein
MLFTKYRIFILKIKYLILNNLCFITGRAGFCGAICGWKTAYPAIISVK